MWHTTPKHEGCSTAQKSKKSPCPLCHQEAKSVLGKTLNALLHTSTKENLSSLEGFYYCKNPLCKSVYFRNDVVLKQEDLRVSVGLKEGVSPAMLCYCFQWSKERIQEEFHATGKSSALEDIKVKMKDPGCSCETLNPSGSCCLVDVSAFIKTLK